MSRCAQTPGSGWQASASSQALRQRASLLARVREYFAQQEVLEVETPLLCSAGVTDPNIESFVTAPAAPGEQPRYLSTSPEFAMKRLLATGSGPIYQVCKAFRHGEAGRLHNPEFTMLEWYRPAYDHHQLMAEVAELVTLLSDGQRGYGETQYLTYVECFRNWLQIDPLTASVDSLRACAREQGVGEVSGLADEDRDGWLDLLMSHCIQPQLGQGRLSFVHAYPASQAALARLLPDNPALAARFELFIDGVEIANGFHELLDAQEQAARFAADLIRRERLGMSAVPVDEYLLAALAAGLPDCAGVALGLDRLLMVMHGADSLQQVQAFPWQRV